MEPSQAGPLRTHVETRRFAPRRGEIEEMRDRLGPLNAATRHFPFANLQVAISFLLPAEEYHVKARLALPGRVLLTGEHDSVVMPPYEHCIRKLARKTELEVLRGQLSVNRTAPRDPAQARSEVDRLSADRLEQPRLDRAFGKNDCQAFLAELSGYRDAIRDHVRAWIGRHVAGRTVFRDEDVLDDLVDEVLLNAFERYESRPSSLRIGDWIEILIDPALRSMLGRPDEPNEAAGYGRSLHEMRAGMPRANDRPGTSPTDSRTQWPTDPPRGKNECSTDAPKRG